jgi:hypothetical protein
VAQHAEPAERVGREYAKADQGIAAGGREGFPEQAELVGQGEQVGRALLLRGVAEPTEAGPGEQGVDIDTSAPRQALMRCTTSVADRYFTLATACVRTRPALVSCLVSLLVGWPRILRFCPGAFFIMCACEISTLRKMIPSLSKNDHFR